MNETLLSALALIPALVVAIVFHEVAHGWTALMLGDPTAKERKRLSLNPIRHVDPVGTVFLPGLLALWLCLRALEHSSLRRQVPAGLAIGAATGTRYFLAGLGPVLVLVDFLVWKRASERCGPCGPWLRLWPTGSSPCPTRRCTS